MEIWRNHIESKFLKKKSRITVVQTKTQLEVVSNLCKRKFDRGKLPLFSNPLQLFIKIFLL